MKRKQHDIVDEILKLGAQMRTKYRVRETINGKILQPIKEERPPRGANRKNIQRLLRAAPKKKPPKPKPSKIPQLIAHTERDSEGREVTHYYGDPAAWMSQFSHAKHELVEPHGTARDAALMQMHADGLPDKKIAELANVTVKTVERALQGKRVRPRTRRHR